MEKHRRRRTSNRSEWIIRRPLIGTFLFSVMCFLCLIPCFQNTASMEPEYLIDGIDLFFYSIVGFSIWLPITVVMFTLLALYLYFYFRFKVVIHEKSFSVTPIFGATYDVPYASVEKVVHVGGSTKGMFIDIYYQNKKLRIFYTRNRYGAFKQKGIEVLLRKFRSCKIPISEHLDMRENWGKKNFS